MKLLIVGINPGLWTAATRTPFAHPGNRFYPALLAGGVIDREIDRVDGMSDADRQYLLDRGIGMTNLVRRATARADELSRDELRAGGKRLLRTVETYRPRVVAVAGITAYRTAFGDRTAKPGRQERGIGTDDYRAQLWIVPNPSGLNAHETIPSLARAYRRPAEAAGIVPAQEDDGTAANAAGSTAR